VCVRACVHLCVMCFLSVCVVCTSVERYEVYLKPA
jgi:hypothetical protein